MEVERLFDLGVKILAGVLVFITFRWKCLEPMKLKITQPHDELHKRCDEYEKTQSVLISGQLALLHDRVYQACKHYIDEDCIDVEDLKNLEHLFDAYVLMGGNGTCKQMFGRVCELKYKKEDER